MVAAGVATTVADLGEEAINGKQSNLLLGRTKRASAKMEELVMKSSGRFLSIAAMITAVAAIVMTLPDLLRPPHTGLRSWAH